MNKVTLIDPDQCDDWILKDGMIRLRTGRYFSICKLNGQPFIDQPEIGLLGWVKDWLGNYIGQLKFEPGNIADTQLTCTVQATQSNMERVHGGKEQPFLEYLTRPPLSACWRAAPNRSVSGGTRTASAGGWWKRHRGDDPHVDRKQRA